MSVDRRPSTSGSSSLVSPPSVSPEPAYIAASAASQIINSDRADFDGDGTENEIDIATISPGSLVLINTFLDQLLFSFLANARSTSIASLRPAILDVLKPRLGKEAIDGADEELQGYLAGGDTEELFAFHNDQELKGEYNVNLTWRRTRLRCMVYTRLGDMEEEDEEIYLEQEGENETNDARPRLNRDFGSVSPAAAIFLTSILEFIGEQVLLVVGEAAFNRAQIRRTGSERIRVMVEEVDVEKLAFNTTLGRLWRSWKKRVRSSSLLSHRPTSRDTPRQKANSLSAGGSISGNSISEENDSGYFGVTRQPTVAEVLKTNRVSHVIDENLPAEPDFSGFSTEASSPETKKTKRGRPRSMGEYGQAIGKSPVPLSSKMVLPNGQNPGLAAGGGRPVQRRQRSSSLPAKQTPYVSPIDETFTTPTEGPDPFRYASERLNAEKEMPKLTDDAKTVHRLGGDSMMSTMYDGAISPGTEPLPETMAERNDRGISTYTESSNYTYEYDQEVAPQALNPTKPTETPSVEPQHTRTSTLSSNYSFQAGDITPNQHHVESCEDPIAKARREVPSGNDQHTSSLANFSTLQGHHTRPQTESEIAAERDIPALYDGPSNSNYFETSLHSTNGPQGEWDISTPTRTEHRAENFQQCVPALTPLQELRDAAQDTSDEASSSAPSYEAAKTESFTPAHRYQGSDGLRAVSISSSTFNQSQQRTSASRSIEPRSQPSAVNTGTERAAVQRVSPSSATHLSRASTSSNRDGRPMTAGSTTSHVSSKIKGMIGRESGDLVRQPMPKRTSSEGSGSLIKTPNKEQDFEELIKSDETVKYTLTPQNMREMETPDSPRWQTQPRSQTSELPDLPRESTSSAADPARPSAARSLSKLKGLHGLRSNPTNSTSPTLPTHAPSLSRGTETTRPKPVIPKSPGPRNPSVVAREPIHKDDSLRDFADFIRSTGPDAPPKPLQKPALSNNVRSSRPGSSSSPTAGTGKPLPKKTTKQNNTTNTQPKIQPQKPEKVSSKLQAREPTVINNDATADLADFFRSEPAGGHVDRSQSQRTGAAAAAQTASPNGLGLSNGRMREAVNSGSSFASTQDSFAASKMTQSSSNSRTGLLDSTNRSPQIGSAPVRNSAQSSARNDDTPGPTRKQHRNKDPYALDDSDDEDSYGSTPQPPPEREEESLSDFLRNYHPSPEATTTRTPPIISGAPKPAKQNNPSIRERLVRNIAVVPDYRPLLPKAPKKDTSSSSKSPPQSNRERPKSRRNYSGQSVTSFTPPTQNNIIRAGDGPKPSTFYPTPNPISTNPNNPNSNTPAPQLPPLNPRATSPHLISQNGNKIDSYRPTHPTYAKHINHGAPRKQLQAREESMGNGGSGMNDLADFLRETEPPKPAPVRHVSPVREKEKEGGGGFGRMFGRRRKEGR